jgi:HSP20 family protein
LENEKGGDILPEEEDWWPKWFRRRSWWPFSRRWMFRDINEIFEDMEEMMREEFRKASEKAPKDLIRERTLPSGAKVKEWGPFVYGYSVTVGPEGSPQIREFGNIKPGTRMGRPRVNIREQREPLIDVFETEGEIKVIAELPGVEKNDIKLQATDENLTISVNTPKRKYHKDVKLPASIDPKQADSEYKNGVLEVTLKKREPEKKQGEQIPIK